MPYQIVMFGFRKTSLSAEQFRAHYENVHIPLVKEVSGPHFPISHTRRYVQYQEGDSKSPLVLQGSPSDLQWDVLTELVFESEAKFFEFGKVMATSDIAARIAEDCDKFMDSSKSIAVVIGMVSTTTS